jgi:UDP-3-O-[3-hydroxymyristoyl] glucosamine N-acyltransferase
LPDAKIGQEGFGFTLPWDVFLWFLQLCRRRRARLAPTPPSTEARRAIRIVGSGTRTDNSIQIGHSVALGHQCIVVAQLGIAGSTTVGDFTRIGGQVAIAGHVPVIFDIKDGAVLPGSPRQAKRIFCGRSSP